MNLLIILLIIALIIVLVGLGASIVIGEKSSAEDPQEQIKVSGKYNVNVKPIRDELYKVKPSTAEIREFLENGSDNFTNEQMEVYIQQWEDSLEYTIKTLEDGYRQDVQTFRYVIPEKEQKHCQFLGRGNYITRIQIYSHPELLPPFCLGDEIKLVSKEAWEANDEGGWVPITPVEGRYLVPDWRQIAK